MSRSSSVGSPSPTTFLMAEADSPPVIGTAATSTAASSPPPSESENDAETDVGDADVDGAQTLDDPDIESRYKHLEAVLHKSEIYANVLREQMEKHKAMQAKFISKPSGSSSSPPSKSKSKSKSRSSEQTTRKAQSNSKKRVLESDSSEDEAEDRDEDSAKKRQKLEDPAAANVDVDEGGVVFQQPSLITGAKMKDYQLEGLQWMVALHQNGISGILADEMGLGKTLQTIAFSAYLRQVTSEPFLVVCPLSVLHNWVEEYKKFAPDIPVCMYHGSPAERAELRRTVMNPAQLVRTTAEVLLKKAKKKKAPPPKKIAAKGKRGRKPKKPVSSDEEEEDDEPADDVPVQQPIVVQTTFPVVITTYEMIINDRIHLSNYNWGYIVVDEGHRLKNLDCRLMREIKKYPTASRMILTGTPLHNNLAELWSLLNFVLPDIFNDIESFQDWFNLPTMQSTLPTDRATHIISKLHTILKPFLLRRLKVDVETNLPPKKEYVLYAPLSEKQRELYDRTLDGQLKGWLLGKAGEGAGKKVEKIVMDVDIDAPMKLRSTGKKKKAGKRGKAKSDSEDEVEAEDVAHLAREHHRKAALKQINSMHLQNTVMQLRKVCSHPFLFDWPLDPLTMQPTLDEELVDSSGKMMVLERLLDELFMRGHRVLLFSQFTKMLDIIEDWATEFKSWPLCRIDGKTSPMERRDQMNLFQSSIENPDDESIPKLFLLSTRAGGLGINLTAADTVIFYDQDWNPQMDAQAQDRAHRIGQTKPVLIFRLLSAHTIETKIMQRATEKRKLEALVIAKGKFKKPAAGPNAAGAKRETVADMAAALLRLEGEKIEVVPNTAAGKASVLSDEDLEMLLDRRPEVFVDRGVGWTSAGTTAHAGKEALGEGVTLAGEEGGKKTAFEVYKAPRDEGNEVLAGMLGEEIV